MHLVRGQLAVHARDLDAVDPPQPASDAAVDLALVLEVELVHHPLADLAQRGPNVEGGEGRSHRPGQRVEQHQVGARAGGDPGADELDRHGLAVEHGPVGLRVRPYRHRGVEVDFVEHAGRRAAPGGPQRLLDVAGPERPRGRLQRAADRHGDGVAQLGGQQPGPHQAVEPGERDLRGRGLARDGAPGIDQGRERGGQVGGVRHARPGSRGSSRSAARAAPPE